VKFRRGNDKVGQKLRRLQAVTDSTLSALNLDDLLAELLERTREMLSADTAAILLLDASGADLVVTAVAGLESDSHVGLRHPTAEGFAGRIAMTGKPATFDRTRSGGPSEFLEEQNLRTMIGVPMIAGGRTVGVLHVGSRQARAFSDDDLELLQLVADRAGLAAQVQLSRLDRAATLALQRSLLPSRPIPIPGFDLAASYVPGAQVGVGGDWYDAFALPSGHTGLVIGDVAGNGLRAAVVMGRIRSALRAYALETPDPADALSRLDTKIQLFEPGAVATAIYAVIDPSQETMTYSVAGHLPPMRIAGERASLLQVKVDAPLGAFAHAERRSSTIDFPRQEGFVFYTDGLVERRGQYVSEGIQRLRARLTSPTADGLCTQAVSLLSHQEATDDLAVLAVVRAAEPA
jgi:phosphoserine phosphatase RsbU/P